MNNKQSNTQPPDIKFRVGSNYKKICALCGEAVREFRSDLQRHCARQHQGSNEGFLKVGQSPAIPKYVNLQQFVSETATVL